MLVDKRWLRVYILFSDNNRGEIMKVRLLKPGFSATLVDYSKVKFPVKVEAKRYKNRLGQVCAFWISQDEIKRIGGVIRSQEAVGNDSFLFSIALEEVE